MKKLILTILCAVTAVAMHAAAIEGALPGVFSVSADKQVVFSRGNLQYQANGMFWRFAEHQYDFVGNSSMGNVSFALDKSNNARIDRYYDGWIDLFGWGSGEEPWLATENLVDYGVYTEWAANTIINGGILNDGWRTLNWEEWLYLFLNRPNAEQLRGQATVNKVHGYIFLPDNWELPKKLTFTPNARSWDVNVYSTSQWDKMEKNGAVFLPAGGFRVGTEVSMVGHFGFYWSSSLFNDLASGDGRDFYFSVNKEGPRDHEKRFYGLAVRPVLDVWGGQPQQQAVQEIHYQPQPVVQPAPQPVQQSQPAQKPEPKPQPVTITKPTSQPQPAQQTQQPQQRKATVTVAGVLPGLFSVGAGAQVQFAQGNVQYKPSTSTWRFADNQYDFVGTEETGNVYSGGEKCQNEKIKSKYYTGWLDLFGWGTANNPTDYKMIPSLYENFVDWGKNPFINGGNKADMWRTLSSDEWTYLLNKRVNATALRGQAVVNDVKGYMLLPDNWVAPAGISFRPEPENYTTNVYTAAQWDKMEKNGAVFLPEAGVRTLLNSLPDEGCYWSSSWHNKEEDEAAYMWFYARGSGPSATRATHNGHSVRLVLNMREVAKPSPKVVSEKESQPKPAAEPQPVVTNSGKTNPVPVGGLPGIFSVSANKKVYFSMGNAQYNEDGYAGSTKFADHQWEIVGDATQGDVYYNGVKSDNNKANRGYAGWIDLHEWGGSMGQNSAKYVYSTFYGYKEWGDWCFRNGGYPEGELWRTPTTEEWIYLFDQRKNAAKLRGQATVNNHHGYVLLPDNWLLPQGLTFKPQPNNWTANTYTADQWAQMEKNGAVFLPAAGVRAGKEVQGIGEMGAYWSSSMYQQTGEGDVDARGISFTANSAKSNVYDTWHHGFSVRLVQDIDFVKPKKKSVWDDVPAEQVASLPEMEPEQEWKLYEDIKTIGDINPREGFRRIKVDPNSFGAYLRSFPLKDDWNLYYYDGNPVKNQTGGYAVLDIDIGTKDLLQCADAVMFLRASYLYAQKRYKDIHFNSLSGFKLEYARYAEGERLKNVNGKLSWVKSTKPDYSYATFRKFMDLVFGYANTASLEKELPQRKIEDVQIGDIFVVSGNPGHAMMVVDMAIDKEGNRALLFAQGMMPAQSVHVVTNLEHGEDTPWYLIDKYLDWGSLLIFPNYVFSADTDLKYFPE